MKTTLDQITDELVQLTEAQQQQVLEHIRGLKAADDRVWDAYLASEQENEQLYVRLADA